MPTKLGVHVNQGSRNGYGQVLEAVPAVVIAVGEGGALVEARQKSGGRTLTIFREQTVFHDAPNGIDHMTLDQVKATAEANWPKLRQKYELNPADYYQVTNETGGDNPQALRNITAFEMHLMDLAERDGFHLAVGSPAGGSPGRWKLWVQFMVPLIRRAERGEHIYSRHAYGGVASDNGFLTKVSAGQIIAADDNAARPFREAVFLRSQGIKTPMVITEAGQNAGFKFPGRNAFIEDARRYDILCQQHENIWGFCLWTYGKYQNFPANIQGASGKMAEYLRSQGGATRPAYPKATDGPAPNQVGHIIHLLPQDASLLELKQLTSALHPSLSTFTYSADAAHAIAHFGDDHSRVVVWDSQRWDGNIINWLHERGVATVSRSFVDATDSPFDDTTAGPGAVGGLAIPARIAHTIHLLPQDTTLAEIELLAATLHANRSTFTFSRDAAHSLAHAGNEDSISIIWSGQRWAGDIIRWFHDRGVVTETRNFEVVAEPEFSLTHWPTEHFAITQAFNANPQLYREFGLTGHEGIDIRAPFGSKVFAAAPGRVFKVRRADAGHAYGNAVYIRHRNGYRTSYAHLKELFVSVGDLVRGGQPIGLADSTGRVFPKPTLSDPTRGAHLHLSLYHAGATASGETGQPNDLIDPTPFLMPLLESTWLPPQEPLVAGWAVAASLERRGSLAQVNVSFINLRAKPGTNQQKIGRVRQGQTLRVTGQKRRGYLPVLVSQGAVLADEEPPVQPVELGFGIHNEDGAEWMLANGVRGWSLHTVALGPNATAINHSRFERAGIKMIVRLNYGYHPQGNIPLDNHPDYPKFINACVKTLRDSRGVWGFVLGNETNNPAEFPGGVNGERITADRYAELYNRVWAKKPAGVRLAPQAVDPYFGPGNDNRAYWIRILERIDGADFLTVHPKTQNSDPNNVDSDAKFSDDPLRWQYLHLRSYQPLLAVVPTRFGHLPVIATEVNPQRHNNGKLGWQENLGAEWVRRAAAHFEAHNRSGSGPENRPVTGVIFYRFSADDWAINNKPSILNAIKQAASD